MKNFKEISKRAAIGIIILSAFIYFSPLKNFYMVSTVGKDGGIIGWVSEDYIYEIITEPQR